MKPKTEAIIYNTKLTLIVICFLFMVPLYLVERIAMFFIKRIGSFLFSQIVSSTIKLSPEASNIVETGEGYKQFVIGFMAGMNHE